MNKTLLSTALVVAMGISANTSAATVNFDWTGAWTMINPDTSVLPNSDSAGGSGVNDDAFGVRTTITGTMSVDRDVGFANVTMDPFPFNGNTAIPHDFTLQAIGDGFGGPGTLIRGSLLFDWGGTLDIPVHLVADGFGFLSAYPYSPLGEIIDGGISSSTDDAVAASGFGALVSGICDGSTPGVLGGGDTGAIGCPLSMTTLDVNQDASGNLINDGFPLTDDGISGVPIQIFPYPGHQMNFDFTSMMVTSIPVPAAVWLFGSGLLGLLGVSLRKKEAAG